MGRERDQKAYHAAYYLKNKERMVAKAREWVLANPEKVRAYSRKHGLKKAYGLTPEQVDDMLAAQGHACAACRDPLAAFPRPHVDHDHTTGKVRGVLCAHCNRGLGSFKDSPERLEKAAEYLRKSRG